MKKPSTTKLPKWSRVIAREMTSRTWSYAKLAKKTRIAGGTLWQWAHGKQEPRASAIRKLCKAFKLEPNDLL